MSTVLYIVLNFIHSQTLASDTNIFASVFQFLFLFASDATQAFISYQDLLNLPRITKVFANARITKLS